MLALSDIYEAKERLTGVIHHTATEQSATFSAMTGADVYLKRENQQKTGSFKVRGATNMIKKLNLKKGSTVVSCSAGNHAQGVAFAAMSAGLNATIFMPISTPIAKVSATKAYGAAVKLVGNVFDDSQAAALEECKRLGAVFIPPFNDESVIAGQGTIALEILQDLRNVDVILVPAGGGGLLAGVAFAAKQINPSVKIYGVQAENAAAIAKSYKRKEVVALDRVFTIADGIAVKRPGDITMQYINEYADDILTVSDDEIASTIIALIERDKQIVEPAGAAGLAAVLSNRFDFKGKRVVCVLSGGNIDVSFIHKIIEKGLVSRGRQMRLSVVLADKPGSLEELAHVMSINGANIISVQYDRVSADITLNETILHIAFEASGFEHGKRVIDALNNAGFKML